MFPKALHTQIPAVKSQKQKSPASRVAGFVPFKLKSSCRGSRRGSPVRDRTGSRLTLSRPAASATARAPPVPGAPQHSAPGPAFLAASSPLQRAWWGRKAAQTKRSTGPGAVGAEARPCLPGSLPPSLVRSPLVSRRPQSPRRQGPTPSSPRGRRSGPARQGAAGRPRLARAEEGAAAATMSARPSQKLGASGQCAAAARAERAPRPTPPTPAE